jgi:hypothetical protein
MQPILPATPEDVSFLSLVRKLAFYEREPDAARDGEPATLAGVTYK